PSPPSNDGWANAVDVSGAGPWSFAGTTPSSAFSGTTVGATGEPGEPNHGGVAAPIQSAWYKLMLANDATATITTCGSGFDTVLAAYTGSAVNALTEVTSNDNGCGAQSVITF